MCETENKENKIETPAETEPQEMYEVNPDRPHDVHITLDVAENPFFSVNVHVLEGTDDNDEEEDA